MLVLQRKKNQSILIGDNIELSVMEMGSDWVKLAISAPKEVAILRKELVEAAQTNRDSVGTAPLNLLKKMMKKEEKEEKEE